MGERGGIAVNHADLERYALLANEAERIVFQSGENITGSKVHCEIITSLTRAIRSLIDYIREENQVKKD